MYILHIIPLASLWLHESFSYQSIGRRNALCSGAKALRKNPKVVARFGRSSVKDFEFRNNKTINFQKIDLEHVIVIFFELFYMKKYQNQKTWIVNTQTATHTHCGRSCGIQKWEKTSKWFFPNNFFFHFLTKISKIPKKIIYEWKKMIIKELISSFFFIPTNWTKKKHRIYISKITTKNE